MREGYSFLRRYWSILLLVGVSATGVILDAFGMFPIPKLSSFLLVLVCTFAIHQAFINVQLITRMDELALSSGVSGLVDVAGFYSNLANLVSRARHSVDLTYHSPVEPAGADAELRAHFLKNLDRAIRLQNVVVRRIVTINTYEKLQTVRAWLEKYRDCPSLCVRHSNKEVPVGGPPLSLQIIDDEVCLIAGLQFGFIMMSEKNLNIMIQDRKVVSAYKAYYNHYWRGLDIIKEDNFINYELLARLEKALRPSDSLKEVEEEHVQDWGGDKGPTEHKKLGDPNGAHNS